MLDSRFSHYGDSPPALDNFTDDELRAELAARMRRDAAWRAQRYFIDRQSWFGYACELDTGKVHGPTANPNNIDCGCGWGKICDAERGYFTGHPYTLCGAMPFPCTGAERNRAADRTTRRDDWRDIVDTTC